MNPGGFDVAVVGLGPVGCLATLLLAESGLRVVAFEKESEVYRLPRAVNLDGEIIRALQPSGLARSVDRMMQKIRPGERAGFTNSKREWLFGANSISFGSNGWQPANMFDQPELEQFLRDQAINHANVTSYIGATLDRCSQTEDSVQLFASKNGELIEATAQYMIASDGAASPVRKSFDIEWRDLGYNRDWLVVDVAVNERHTLNNEVLQVCDPRRLHTYVATKDPYRRWEFRLNPGETAEQMLETETIQSLIDAWTPRNSYTIRRAAVYQFHAATAARWQVGRVFLAGDAAHQTPPFLGQGMNTGMRDVVNLAWKLDLVLHQKSQPELLQSYQAERDAHAHDLVSWAVSLGRLMEHMADQEACAERGDPAPEAPAEMVSSGYGQGREQPPIRAGIILQEQVSNDGITGYLFNQPDVKVGEGKPQKLDTLLGPGFALVGYSIRDLYLNPNSLALLELFNIEMLDLGELELVRGRFAEIPEGEVALVRPDRIVFGHTTLSNDINDLLDKFQNAMVLEGAAASLQP